MTRLLIWINLLLFEMVNKLENQCFVFGVNTGAWGRRVHGSEAVDDFRVLFKKVGRRFIPYGEASEIFMAGGNDRPGCSENISDLLKELGVGVVFTCDIPFQEGYLLNLVNVSVQKDWDYEKDPYPSAEVYYGLDPSFYGEFLYKDGAVKVVKVDNKNII